ncbi:MAG: hypothetical protein N3F64_00645 [Nitrososphaeria archaeon]|nr:hypothetical protein [Nitrososphaeria archaeon]
MDRVCARLLRACGDALRLKILALLHVFEFCVCDIISVTDKRIFDIIGAVSPDFLDPIKKHLIEF